MFLRSVRTAEVRRLNSFTLKPSSKCLPQRFALLPNRELSIKTAEQLPPVGQSLKSPQQNRLSSAESVSVFGGSASMPRMSFIFSLKNSGFSLLGRQKTRSPTHLDGFTHIYAYR